jgi:hypothetical protein
MTMNVNELEACDLGAEIRFAGEVMRPPPLSLDDLSVRFEADPFTCRDAKGA